ncbi:MAG: citryl-CoA lyase [Chloroflexi bacterium]|nr:citryl-CoA lyase [Chloroflexota bacterium]
MSNSVSTAISRVDPEQVLVRGYNLADLIGRYSFGDVVYLLLAGDLPSRSEGKMIEAILVACAEHSIDAPSIHVARTVASCGVPTQQAISAGIGAIGDYHGGAGEACAKLLQEAVHERRETPPTEVATDIIAGYRRSGRRLPGFGHRFHTPVDPRARKLLQLSDRWHISAPHVALARAIEDTLRTDTGRALPLNVDGALAAIMSDMGLDWRLGKSLFIIARSAGLSAHVHEELLVGKPLKFAGRSEIEYIGPPERSLPEAQ